MKFTRRIAGHMAGVMTLGLLLTACAPKQEGPGSTDLPPLSDSPATLGQAADYLMTAAEGYHQGLDRSALLDGMEGGEKVLSTRLQALVMVSRAFGYLPVPTGANALLAAKDIDLSGVPDWAKADLENLAHGGALAPADLGQEETDSSGTDEGIMAEDIALPSAPDGDASDEDYGLATPVGEPDPILGVSDSEAASWDAPVSLKDVETYCKRIYALLGTDLKDDFYAAVNKTALENTGIPQGWSAGGGSDAVAYKTNEQVRTLIREIVESGEDYAPGSSEQKIRDFYRSVLAPRTQGTAALKPWFEKIDAAGTLAELRQVQTELIEYLGLSANGLLPFAMLNDLTDTEKKVLNLTGGFMAMTVEEYEDPNGEAYQSYRSALVERLMETGETEQSAGPLADAMIALELDQLKNGMTAEEAADLNNYNNTFTMEELDAMMPELGVREFFTSLGFDPSMPIQVYDVKATRILATHMNGRELPRLKAQVKLSLLGSSLSQLTGEATEEQALDEVSGYLSTEVGQLYVQRHFSAQAKAGVQEMVNKLIDAFKARINALDWMAEDTKREAINKLDTLTVLIGYPDEWTENLAEIKAPENGGTYFENMGAIARERLRQDVENQHGGGNSFGLDAFMVNAAANRQSNTLVFPAGILQAPFYDPDASLEENLGGIGVIIAHEITHVFDDQGAQYDSKGAVRNWWTEEDYTHFRSLCENVTGFYDGAEAAPGIAADGKATLSENISDIGGVACALEVLSGMENPDYDKFFRSYANAWLQVTGRADAAMLAASDDHAPKKLRVNKVLQNFQEFFDTYGIEEGDGMYLAPEQRVKIW